MKRFLGGGSSLPPAHPPAAPSGENPMWSYLSLFLLLQTDVPQAVVALVALGWDLWGSLEPDGQQMLCPSPLQTPKRAESVPQSWLQGDTAAPPQCWGQAGGPTGVALLGCPQGMGRVTLKPSLAFSCFFLSFFNDDYFYCDLTTCFNDTCSLFSNTLGARNKVHKESLFGCCGCAPLFFPALIP